MSSSGPDPEPESAKKNGGKSSRVTINDIAAMCGVSKKSVSRVINEEAGISDKTRKRIKEVMARENYTPDRRARALAASRSFLIALAHNNVNASYVLDLMKGMQQTANLHGYEVVMHCELGEGVDAVKNIQSFMQRSGCDGIVLTPPLSEHPDVIGAFSGADWEIVRIAGDDVELSVLQVKYDDRAAALDVTRHLIDLGHTRIGFIGGAKSNGPTRRRLAGVRDALTLQGHSLDESQMAWGDFTFTSGLESGKSLINTPVPPTAIICCNDEMAAGALHAIRDAGLRVPDDISVTGFDDSPLAQQLWPALTSVRQPVSDMASQAAESLTCLLSKSKDAAKQRNFSHKLMVRNSTAAPR